MEQGVSSPIISGIVEDGNENIWVTTARGITNVIPAVDLKTGRYIFIVVFMMIKMVCKIVGSTCVPLKIVFWRNFMGGLYGINRFRPDDIKYNKNVPA